MCILQPLLVTTDFLIIPLNQMITASSKFHSCSIIRLFFYLLIRSLFILSFHQCCGCRLSCDVKPIIFVKALRNTMPLSVISPIMPRKQDVLLYLYRQWLYISHTVTPPVVSSIIWYDV